MTPRPLLITPRAEQDILEALAWYDSRRDGLGTEFLSCVDAALQAIQDRAESFPAIHREIRRALVRRFPYGVFFVIDPDQIAVLSIMHASRDPQLATDTLI